MPTFPTGDGLSGLYQSQPDYFATFQAQLGGNFASILTSLEEKFPAVPLAYLESAAISGVQAAGLDPVFKKLPRGRRINPDLIPVDPNLTSGYRYILTVACADESGHDITYRTFIVDSAENLTKGEIQQAGRDAFAAALASPKYDLVSLQCSPDMIALAGIQGIFRAG